MLTLSLRPHTLFYFVVASGLSASLSADASATTLAQNTPPATAAPAVAAPSPPPAAPSPSPTLIIPDEPTPCPVAVTCPPPPPAEESPFGYDSGLYLRTKDRKYSLVVNGFAQLLYELNATPSAPINSINQGFYLALGRLALSGNIFSQKLSYFFQFEGSTFGNNNGISMLDWWMSYKVNSYFSVTAGRFILPYSRQFYTHPGNLLFADLSPADYAFNLPRAIGVKAGGSVSRLSYDVFIVNSVRSLGVGTQINRGDSIAAGGRLELAILDPYGYMETMPKAPDRPQLSLGVAVAYNPIADASTFQNVAAGDNTVNTTADLGFRYRRLTIQGAFYYRYVTGNVAANNYGFYGQAGVYLISERLELAGRASGAILADRTLTPGLMNTALGSNYEYTGGLNAYLFGHGAKLQTDYTYINNDPFGGASFGTHRWRVQVQVLF